MKIKNEITKEINDVENSIENLSRKLENIINENNFDENNIYTKLYRNLGEVIYILENNEEFIED